MSKTLLNKFKLVLAVIMAVALMLATGIFGTSAKAEDVFSLDSVEYTMDGASIRIGEEDGVNGVKFLAKLSVEDYDRITANVGEEKMYASIEYGVLIAPKYFTNYYPLNEDTVFGANGIQKKVYDWAILGETRWEYTGTNSLPAVGGTGVRIINIYTNDWELGEDREHTEKYMYSGAIVNIQDGKLGGVNNLAEDFYSVAYIKATKEDGSVDYKFTSNSVSKSAAFLAQQTIEDEESGLTAEQLQWLQENYVDAAKGSKTFTYTTNYFKEGPSGEAILDEAVVTEAELDATVDAEEKTYDGYTLDENYEGTRLSGKVYANNSLALNLYYVADVKGGLVDKTVYSYIYPEKLISVDEESATVKLYRMAGEYGLSTLTDDSSVVWNVMGDTSKNSKGDKVAEYTCAFVSTYTVDFEEENRDPIVVSTDLLSGTYRFISGHDETVVVNGESLTIFVIDDYVDFDVYDSTKDAVWNVAENATTGTRAARSWAAQTNRGYVVGWGVDFSLVEKAGANLPEGAPGTSYFYGTTNRNHTSNGGNLTGFTQNFYIKPLHSLAYYQRLADLPDLDVSLYFDYYVGTDNVTIGGTQSETTYTSTKVKTIADASAKTVNLNTWYTVEVKLSTIISNWSNLSPIASDNTAGRWLAVDAVANPSDETKRVPLDVYFGNFRFESALGLVEDEETHLVPLATQAEDVYDFTSTMSQEFMTKLNTWRTLFGDPVVTITDNFGTVVTLDGWSGGNRTVTNFKVIPSFHKAYTVDFKVNGVIVYTSHVDFCWEGNGFVYSKNSNSDVKAATKGFYPSFEDGVDNLTLTFNAALDSSNVTGDTSAIGVSSMVKYNGQTPSVTYFSIVPAHSKEYYQKYSDAGAKITLGMYIYVPADKAAELTTAQTKLVNQYGFLSETVDQQTTGDKVVEIKDEEENVTGTQFNSIWNKWIERTISFDLLLNVWDTTFAANPYVWGDTASHMFYVDFKGAFHDVEGAKVFFRVTGNNTDPSTIVPVTKDGVELIDVNDIQTKTYDLANLINEDGQKILTDWSSLADITYSLTDMVGNVVFDNATDTIIDVSQEINQRHFKFTANVDGYPAYVAEVDFYDSTKAPVWNTVSEDNVGFTHSFKVYSWGTTNSDVDNVEVSNGNYAFTFPTRQVDTLDNAVKVLPLHSFDYYKQFANLGVKLNFTYYFEAPDSDAAVTTAYRAYGNSDRPDIVSGEANKTTISISLDTFLTEDNWNAYVSNSIEGDTLLNYNFLIKELAWVDRPYRDSIVMYVGGFELVVGDVSAVTDEDVKLIDVSTESENGNYNFYNAISTAGQTLIEKYASVSTITYTLTDNAGNVVGPTESTTINVNDSANLRAYTLNAYIGDQLAYTGYIDLYDPSAPLIWNDISESSLSFLKTHTRAYNRNDPAVNGTSTVVEVDGANYYKTTFDNLIGGNVGGFMTMYGLHSEELYRQYYYGKGINLNFTFFYGNNVVNDDGSYTVISEDFHWFGYVNPSDTWRPGVREVETSGTTGLSTKYTRSISFDTLLDNWDLYTAGKPTANHHSGATYDNLVALCSVAYSTKRESVSMYLGGLDLVTTDTISPETDKVNYLVDVNGEETFDVYSKISDEGKALLNKYQGLVTYTLTDNSGVVTELGGKTVIDVTESINLKAYTLNAYVSGQLAYTGYIDLYDSTAPLIWTPVSEAYTSFVALYNQQHYISNKLAISEADANVVYQDGWFKATFADTSGLDNTMTVLPVHSKEYFGENAMNVVGKDISLRFYFYPSVSNTTEFRWFGYGANEDQSYRRGKEISADATAENKLTIDIDLDTLIANWDLYTDVTAVEAAYISHDYLIKDISPTIWPGYDGDRYYYLSGFEFVYAGDFTPVTDETVYIEDVTGDSEISMLPFVNSQEVKNLVKEYSGIATYTLTDNNGEVTDIGAKAILDLTCGNAYKAYTLKAIVGGVVVYTGYVDLYTADEEIYWNDITNANSVQRFNLDHEAVDSTFEAGVFYQKNAVKYTATEQQHPFFTIKPIHSKGFYERFVNKGYYLNYSVYVDIATNSGTAAQIFLQSLEKRYDKNVWIDRSLSIDEIVTYWDYIVDGKCAQDRVTADNPHFESRGYSAMVHVYNTTNSYIYIAGGTISQDLSTISITETKNLDVAENSALNLTEEITSKGQEIIDYAQSLGEVITYTYTDPNGATLIETTIDARLPEKHGAYKVVVYAGEVAIYTLTLNVSNSDLALVEDATAKTLDFMDYNDLIYKTEWLFSDDQKAQFARVDVYAPITYALVDGEGVESSFINAETGVITATNKAVIGTYTFKVKAGDTVIYTKTMTLNHSGYEENNDEFTHLIDVSTLDNQATYALTTNIGAATATRIKKVAKYDTVVARLYDGADKLVQEYPVTTANITDGWDAKIQNLILEFDEEIDLRYYVLKVVASDTDLVVKRLDFYDSTKDYVWNVVHEDLKHYVQAYKGALLQNAVTVVDGQYVINFGTQNKENDVVTIIPLHSKEYYQKIYGLNASIKFKFMQISDATNVTAETYDTNVRIVPGNATSVYEATDAAGWDAKTETTYSASIPFDGFIDNWDSYLAANKTLTKYSALIGASMSTHYPYNVCDTTFYISELSLVVAPDEETVVDSYVYSINAQNRASYDLTNAVRTDAGEKMLDKYTSKTYRITDNNGNVINLGTKSTFAINDDMLRLWKFEVLVGETVICTGYVDLYDMSKPVIWNDEISVKSIAKYIETSKVVSLDTSDGTDVVLTKANGTQIDAVNFAKSSGDATWYVWKPLHDKTYYEKFVGLGYKMTYSAYVDASAFDGTVKAVNQLFLANSQASANIYTSGWYDASMTLDKIVTNWDAIINVNWDGEWTTRAANGMAAINSQATGCLVGFGGFEFTLNIASALNAGDIIIEDNDVTVIKENDVDVNYYNVADFMTNKEQSIIAQYALQDTITSTLVPTYCAGQINVDGLLVPADQVELRAYNLTVKAGDTVICTAVVDFYDEEAEVVWANDLNEYNTLVYTRPFYNGWSNNNTGLTALVFGEGYQIVDASTIVDEASPLYGRTGKYIVLTATEKIDILVTVAPLHSKAYYEKMLGSKDYVLSADMYKAGSFAGAGIAGYKNKDIRYSGTEYTAWRVPGGLSLNAWDSVQWSFDNYLIPSSSTLTSVNTYFDFANIGLTHSFRHNLISFEANEAGAVQYMGMPTIESFAETIYQNKGNMEVDINQSTYYDLTKVLGEQYKNKYNYYVTKYGYDAIYWKVTFADDTKTYIWAQEDGSAYLDLYEKIDETAEGASITIMDKIALGVVRINAYACDIPTFAPMSQPVKGIYGQVNGANNNQQIIIIGGGTVAAANLTGVTFTDMPAQNEVSEISVADGTSKFLRTENFTASAQTYGDIDALYTESVQNQGVALTYKAFKNEYEHAQIQIVAKADLGEYRLLVKDLTSGDNVLSADNFEVYHQLYTKLTFIVGGSANPTGTGEYPDALLPMNVALKNDVAGLKAGVNQGVWITLYVPGDQEAGVYTGTFQLILGTSVYDVPVSVTVYDYEVAEETMMKTSLSLNYTDIVNLETPYEYDEEGKLIVNLSSGNKDATLTDDLRDAYINYFADHRVSTSPVVSSSAFSGSWQGYPYDPDALFSFDVIGTKDDGSPLYSYERPLRNKNEYGETVTVMTDKAISGCDPTYGYPIYNARVDAYFEQLVTLAQNPGVTSYRIPVNQASSTNFNNDNIKKLFTKWAGSLYEINNEMEDGVKASVINQIVLRDVMEKFFLKAMDLHKAGTSVDIFAKASVFPSWIDEFALNNSKILNAQYILKSMKDFFPDLAGWLGKVYADQIAGDEFLLNMLASIANMKINVTANSIEHLDPNEHYANYVLVPELYGSEEERAAVDAWANVAYDGNAEKWIYTAGNTYPQSNNNVEAPLLAGRLIGWMMSEYDIDGYLYWATMRSKYEDGPNVDAIEQAIGKIVEEGQIIELEDFYNNAIHYGNIGGDGFLVYPGSYYNVTGPIGTIRLESLRDGIEDYNIFYDLKEMYKDAGLEESFYNVMRRLAEMIYTGVNMKTQDGYVEDFAIARDSLANMLMMARDHKVYVDNVYNENDAWYFTVVAPSDIAEAVKTSVGATFLSATDVIVNGIAGSKMVFELPEAMINEGYLTVGYGDYVVNLSIETLLEIAEVEALSWATPSAESVYTTHRSYNAYSYEDTVAGTSGTSVELVTLDAENAVGGRTEGNYFYVSPTSNTDTSVLGFALLPTDITLDTVNSYIGKAALKFDVYMDNTYIADGTDRVGEKIYHKLGKSTNSSTKTHRWFSVTIDFEQIAENWDTLNANTTMVYNDDSGKPNWTTSYRALFAVNNHSHEASGVHTTSFYIGNFRIVHV